MNEFFAAVVPENVPVGISVINITATDPDEGLGGEVKYEFLDEGEANGKSLFILFNYLSTNCPNNAYSWSYVNVYFFTFFFKFVCEFAFEMCHELYGEGKHGVENYTKLAKYFNRVCHSEKGPACAACAQHCDVCRVG